MMYSNNEATNFQPSKIVRIVYRNVNEIVS